MQLNNTMIEILVHLHRLRGASASRLVEIMWPESKQPAKKRKTVEGYLKQLKSAGAVWGTSSTNFRGEMIHVVSPYTGMDAIKKSITYSPTGKLMTRLGKHLLKIARGT